MNKTVTEKEMDIPERVITLLLDSSGENPQEIKKILEEVKDRLIIRFDLKYKDAEAMFNMAKEHDNIIRSL